MVYKLLADFVVIIHLAFIVFVVLGAFLVFKYHWFKWIHIPAAIWGAFVEFSGWICPLTPLENHLRFMAGGIGYSGGFVEEYILPIIYPAELTQNMQIVLGIMVVIINLIIYGFLFVKAYSRSKIKE